MLPNRISPQPGQESVWDYPRPPRVEACTDQICVWIGEQMIANSCQTWRVLETSHPPVYYIPATDILMEFLQPTPRTSFCEFKGVASYWHWQQGSRRIENIAWSYRDPTPAFAVIRDHLAFYPSRVDRALVNGEVVQAQAGDFYGGWITSKIVGPFKGGAGTWGW
ncbi:MAG: DUF427 domain-containing protein [Cyanobacteriota bacterium]|nr:DUF427 domain-containing protein [Cyanobacteriota bacterium]